jgi:SAM-dependent methyltransferase
MDQSSDTKSLILLHQNTFDLDYRRKALFEIIINYVHKNDTVLDIGCGTGFMTFQLVKRGIKVCSMDYDKRLINHIEKVIKRNNYEVNTIIYELGSGNLPKNLNKFDLILCLDVIEHIANDMKALSEMKKMLKENGKIIITVPAMPFLYGKRDRYLGHYRRYSKKQFSDLIINSGFKTLKIFHWNFIGFIPYMVYEKIFNKKVNDNLRLKKGKIMFKVFRYLLFNILKFETIFHPPIGLTLVAICRYKNHENIMDAN